MIQILLSNKYVNITSNVKYESRSTSPVITKNCGNCKSLTRKYLTFRLEGQFNVKHKIDDGDNNWKMGKAMQMRLSSDSSRLLQVQY